MEKIALPCVIFAPQCDSGKVWFDLFEKLEGQMYTEMIKVGENAYLAISYTDEYGAIEYFTIEPSKDIGF